MNFRSKIWLLPVSAGAVFGLGLVVSIALGMQNTRDLDALRRVDTPYLELLFEAERGVNQLQADFQAAAMEDDADRLIDAKKTIQRVQDSLTQARNLEGKLEWVRGLSSAFDVYQGVAFQATQGMLKKDTSPELLKRMHAAQKELATQIQRSRMQAHVSLDERFVGLAEGQRKGLLVNAVTGFLIVLGLGLASRAIVMSVWKDLGGEPALLQGIARRVADGDLSHVSSDPAGGEASLSAAMESMTVQLRGIVGAIRQASDSLAGASNEIASGNEDLSSRTEQTASNLQRVAGELSQLSGTVNHSAESAQHARTLATTVASAAQRGGDIVSQVVLNMDEINEASRKITHIIDVIDGISFQTNILALNAAVEAARAGEQGRGFAVVATEVRTLAGRAAKAAREIKFLIGSSSEKVESGLRLVNEAGLAVGEIVEGVQRVVGIISEIGATTTEQSGGIRAVSQKISELDRMTQQNAALVEESAVTAGCLRDQTAQLVQAVSAFKVNG